MTRKKLVLFFLTFFFFWGSTKVLAQEKIGCQNRYLTLINPVRGRNLWLDQSLKPLEDQYGLIKEYRFSATWLLQYDALVDEEIISFVRSNFSDNQEMGLFLEVSPDLAQYSRVIYPHGVAWFDPQAVFLSGYTRSARKKLIDTAFTKFKETFGDYPVSVGAWWIDSYSLQYLEKKYDIESVLIVADQKTTDDYGVWGQWWGVPYYPSRANVLIPAQSEKSKVNLVVLQWAQRDFSKAYGEGPNFSNYSLQANDYPERGLDTFYFKKLINNYLDCSLPFGQITVGLETGIESVKSFSEYQNQLGLLASIEDLQAATMSQFSARFQNYYSSNPGKVVLKDEESEWILTPQKRENKYLKEDIIYEDNLAFIDYFIADQSDFLDRKLPINRVKTESNFYLFLVPLAFILGFVIYARFSLLKYYWGVSLFIFASFLTTFLSYSKFGYKVYFGPVLKNIPLSLFLLVVIYYFLLFVLLKLFNKKAKNTKLLILSFSLSYAIDFIISTLRYIQLENQYYFGFAGDALRFFGLKISSRSLAFVNQDFPAVIASSFLKFDFNLIWEGKIIALVVYPLSHLVLGTFIYLLCKKLPQKLYRVVLLIISIFFCFYLYKTITLDPRIVL